MNKLNILSIAVMALVFAGASCGGNEPQPVTPEKDLTLTFTADLDGTSVSPFKSAWTKDDVVRISGVKEGVLTTESLSPASVSGRTATFKTTGKVNPESEAFYAFIEGSGAENFTLEDGWTVSDESAGSGRTVTVAKADGKSRTLSFTNVYSLLAFNVKEENASYVVFSGNDGEDVSFDARVSAQNLSVTPAVKPSFEAQKEVRVNVSGTGSYCLSLVPGTVLSKGWSLKVYSKEDSLLSLYETSDALTVGKGTLVSSGEFAVPQILFTGKFEDQTSTVFRHTWKEGDAIEVLAVCGSEEVSETLAARNVSADGLTAEFLSQGTLPLKADGYYAHIPGTGVCGWVKSSNWSTGSMDNQAAAVPSVTVAGCTDGTFTFKNVYSVVEFEITEPSISYVVLTGNGGENVDRNMLVSFSKFAVNGNPAPEFEASEAIRRDVNGVGKYHIGLYPGLKLSKGYTITAYNSVNEPIAYSRNNQALTVESGKVCKAAEFNLVRPVAKTKVFDDSHIVLSLGVMSDVHINSGSGTPSPNPAAKFKTALQQVNAVAKKNGASDGVDGILIVGDLIDNPNSSYLATLKNTYESVFDPVKVPMVYTVGNHDVSNYRWSADMVAQSAYIRNGLGADYFLTDKDRDYGARTECRHCVIGEYNVLTITPVSVQPITYTPEAVQWLSRKLTELTEANPEQYVIVLTHPMIQNTVYGSKLGAPGATGEWVSGNGDYWSTTGLTSVLNNYPQAIVYGGHLHFPLNDPRSIWQDRFTVCGTASVRYMALEAGGYDDMSGATVMKDNYNFSQGQLIQFDWNGNIRSLKLDFYNEGTYTAAQIGKPWSLTYPEKSGANLSAYSHTHLSLLNSAPTLSTIEAVKSGAAEVKVSWAAGKDDEFVHHYVLTAVRDGRNYSTNRILADFYLHPNTSGMKTSWSKTFENLPDGAYTFSLVAYDSWDVASNVVKAEVRIGSDLKRVVDDKAGSADFDGGDASVSAGWLSYANGRVSWTANTTGKPRRAVLSMPGGSKVEVIQAEVKDFKGEYTFTSKLFSNDASFHKAGAAQVLDVVFGDPKNPLSITDGHNETHTANIGITGLYREGFVVNASVDIDYGNNLIRFGILLDGMKAQKLSNGKYYALLPGLCASWTKSTGSFSNPWVFVCPDFGLSRDRDYEWLWYEVSTDLQKFTYSSSINAQKLANESAYIDQNKAMPYIIGLCVVGISGEEVTAANAPSDLAKGYTLVYQFNDDASNDGSFFSRK